MNVLVIYAHPYSKSFNGAMLEQVKHGLEESDHVYRVIDLHKDKFNPVLILNDQIRRRDLKDDPETAHYRALIKWSNHLIFIYPIWWYGTPAILKGFFDRVLASGFAFEYDGLMPKGLLQNKSAWVFYTIDSPGWYSRLFRRSAEWIAVKDATLKFCGIRPVKRFMFTGVKRSSPERRRKWLDFVYRQVKYKLRIS